LGLWKNITAGCILLAIGCSREPPQDKGVTIMLDDMPVVAKPGPARLAAADNAPLTAKAEPPVAASPGFSPSIWDGPGMGQQDSGAIARP